MMDNALICLGEVRSQSLQADEMARDAASGAFLDGGDDGRVEGAVGPHRLLAPL